MTKTLRTAKAIANKPDEEVTLADVAALLSAMITGLPKLLAFLGVVVAAGLAAFQWFGGQPGSSPGSVQQIIRAEVRRQDSLHTSRMDRIEDLAVVSLGQNQQQSYQLCLLQPGARPTQCANILLDNRALDSLIRRRR